MPLLLLSPFCFSCSCAYEDMFHLVFVLSNFSSQFENNASIIITPRRTNINRLNSELF